MNNSSNISATPRVSVVMSLYNSKKYLVEAIDSVLNQTFSQFELIIVDDGSSDSGVDIVNSYSDPRILLITQKNRGLPAALNKAIEVARSDMIARMDPDDICLPERLIRQYDYLQQHPESVIVGSAATCIDEHGDRLADIKMTPFHGVGAVVLPESPCIHPSVMFRCSAFEKAGRYPEKMRCGGEDAVLFNRMISYGSIVNLPEPLILYRLHHSSMSHKSKRFNFLLRQLVIKEALEEPISTIERQQLMEEYRCSGSGQFGYHLYVGKLLLASEGDDGRVRSHLIKALQATPLSLHVLLYLLASYMPLAWRTALRSYLKKTIS